MILVIIERIKFKECSHAEDPWATTVKCLSIEAASQGVSKPEVHPSEQEHLARAAVPQVRKHEVLLVPALLRPRRRHRQWACAAHARLKSYFVHLLLASLSEPGLAVEALVRVRGPKRRPRPQENREQSRP